MICALPVAASLPARQAPAARCFIGMATQKADGTIVRPWRAPFAGGALPGSGFGFIKRFEDRHQ
ncbi:hypothetical protein [Sphingomonas sp. CFBP 8760]|uniref:hypothetical protein n=1 Tax=Sphingomonas sp. CFBP 8760 TaxID=2775282 RepID=UPI00178190CF|nr:hypothetical protein [Sphingomonas sp. CFBP 8760]MBD8547672.1 hypothetical protein [Sphingomonas sp. CFBP 8760]